MNNEESHYEKSKVALIADEFNYKNQPHKTPDVSDDSDINNSNNQTNNFPLKKTFFERCFSPIRPGSIRAGIFTMTILSLGTGCLALPKKIGHMSIVVGITDIILAGLCAYLTLKLLSISATKHQIYDYSKLIKKIIGDKWGNLLDLSILIYIFGILILYNVMIYKMIGSVVYDLGGHSTMYPELQNFLEKSFWSTKPYKLSIMFGVGIVIVVPLCLLKDISKMSFTSIFGMTTLFGLILIILIEFPWYLIHYFNYDYNKDDKKTWINVYDISQGFTSELYFFRGISTLFYAYSCHIGAFPIYKTLNEKSVRRIQKVFRRSIIIDAAFYTIVGTTGYLSMPINTPDLIIQRKKIFDSDLLMTIGRIAFVFTLLTKIPANYNSFRISFSEYFLRTSDPSNKQYNVIRYYLF